MQVQEQQRSARDRGGHEQEIHELVVCHGNVLRYLVCRALNVTVHAWVNLHPVYHCSLTRIIIAPNLIEEARDAGIKLATLFSYNDVQHLPPAQRTFG